MQELVEEVKIENLIYEVRGKQVIMDSNVAKLFGYETKYLNRQVQRNIERFPKDYCFQLTEEEYSSLRCQFGTLKNGRGEHTKYMPYVFTEHGITMLAGILKSAVAVAMSLKIVDAFVAMRKYIAINNYGKRISNLETKSIEYDQKFNKVFSKLEKEKNNHIFFEGQIYDAYSLLIDILNQAKKSIIIIIDNYIDKKLLDILSKVNKEIILITKNINKIDLEKYNKQYYNIHIFINTSFHDRFIILDKTTLYHCGASFKDLGKKCFAINKIEDYDYLKELVNHLEMLEMSW